MGKACSLLVPLLCQQVGKQVVCWRGLLWGRGWGFGVFSFYLWQADGIPPSFLHHSPGERMGTSGEQQESIDSSCSFINFL